MAAIVWYDIEGFSHNRKGMINRDVCSADKTSDDPAKISSIQAMAGIHLLTKLRRAMFKRQWPVYARFGSALDDRQSKR